MTGGGGFVLVVAAVAFLAGAIASISGFGIGSLLTPLFALRVPTKLAVAAVSVPHAVATALRFWLLRRHVDRKVLASFGITSAAGGLTGALLHAAAGNPILTVVFGSLLVFVGVTQLSGIAGRMRFRGWIAWVAGAVSGLLGGLVGNQGGIRSAAMLAFDLRPRVFVATATAVGLVVDAARLPVYLATQGRDTADLWPLLLVASAGAVLGTLLGARVLRRVPEPIYRRIVAALVLALGVFMLLFARR
ncbi:MAG: sulfite exporter TauE/SafE family protein [Candidatus Eisenbacteria bacterium]|nr:sulfite exporter TauE/SafE family protein [Candidatus Eisenbacteria bacterium]